MRADWESARGLFICSGCGAEYQVEYTRQSASVRGHACCCICLVPIEQWNSMVDRKFTLVKEPDPEWAMNAPPLRAAP
jgi:hypothetical protein